MEELEDKLKEAERAFYKTPESGSHQRTRSIWMIGATSPEAKEYWQQGMYTKEEVDELIVAAIDDYRRDGYLDLGKFFEENKKKS